MSKSLLRVCNFCLVLVVVGGVILVSPLLRRSIQAQHPDLLTAAARYPRFTRAQRMAVLRQRQFELHPTWKDLSLGEAAKRLIRFASQTVSTAQPSLANFMGNTTAIDSPAGTALALTRQSNCSLDFLYGTFTLSLASPAYTITNTTTNYEQVLHSAAGLTTTADQATQCTDPTVGLAARRSVYVGKTPSGLNVFGSYVYNAAVGQTLVYSVVTDRSFAYQSSASLATGASPIAVLTGDLNKDGIGDLVSLNSPISEVDAPSISAFVGNGDGSFKSATDVTLPGNSAISAVVDDFNNDGILDIVASTETLPTVGSAITYELNFMPGKGDGTFGAAQSFTVTMPAGAVNPYQGLTSVSSRGNQTKDIVTSAGILLLGKGNGTFTQSSTPAFPSLFATSSFGPNIAVADFNKDGKADLAVDDGQTIHIYNGNGDGTFTAGFAYGSIDNVGYLTASDLDGDGNVDLYSGLANGGVFGGDQFEVNAAYALMGNGDGTFAGAPATPFAFTGTNLADLNGDGKLDGVGVNAVLNSTNISFTSYLGKGDGTFSSKSTLAVSPITVQGNSFTFSDIDSFGLGDFNGDGRADLVYLPKGFYAPTGQTGYFMALGDGSGSLGTPVFIAAPGFVPLGDHDTGEQLSNLLVADFNHDGRPDIIYNYSDQGAASGIFYQGIAVQLGNGDGTFKSPQTIQTYSSTTLPSLAPPQVVQTGDTRQDGKTDIFVLVTKVVPSGVATQLDLYLGNGDGTFASPSTPSVADQINAPSFGSALGQIVLADVNSDGHLDLVTLGTTTDNLLGELAVSLGNGDGTYGAPKILKFGGGSSLGYGLAVGDFNGDGKPDVFVGGFNPPFDTGLFVGNGDGTFQTFTSSDGVVQPSLAIDLLVWGPALAADFNGDGKEDVLGGDAVLLNKGVVASNPPAAPASTTTSLSASPSTAVTGTAIVFTAKVTGTGSQTGTVTFDDGTNAIGSAPLSSGSASYSTTSLPVGTHAIIASYGGDTTNAASTSSAATVIITAAAPTPPPGFTLSLSPASGSVAASGSTTTAATITPSNGFAHAVSLTCSGLPAGGTCTFSPAAVTPAGSSVASKLVIATPATASMADPTAPGSKGKLPLAFAGVIVGLALLRDRRRFRSLLLSCIAFSALGIGLLGLGSCGGSSGGGASSPGTTNTAGSTTAAPTTSTITVTATGGSLTQTATYALTVQ